MSFVSDTLLGGDSFQLFPHELDFYELACSTFGQIFALVVQT